MNFENKIKMVWGYGGYAPFSKLGINSFGGI